MLGLIDELCLGLGEVTSQEEDDPLSLLRELADNSVSELLPPDIMMRCRRSCLDGQDGVEEEDSLLCSMREIT